MGELVRVDIRGAVQGVGFRPFVYRLATELLLKGYVKNTSQGVLIEAEGTKKNLDEFLVRLKKEKPEISKITDFDYSFRKSKNYTCFEIVDSTQDGKAIAFVLPDLAVCDDCLNDVLDKKNRRYNYPFTNCTKCGPRFSIIRSLPYDRANTSMKNFLMCDKCKKEYEDQSNRRFHAQPNACFDCGPRVQLWDSEGNVLQNGDKAIEETVKAIKDKKIVALKGLGGFHLICDATDNQAVLKLRQRKMRKEKPFALMYPKIEFVKEHCEVSNLEEKTLNSRESPIVLLKNKGDNTVSSFVAPNNPNLGVMLPYTPLHHILLKELDFPVVATSGNVSDEPICIDENEALTRLGGIADIFLVHNRPIVRALDDSIVRIIAGEVMVLRRARGYAPLPICVSKKIPSAIAVGGQLKNTIAISSSNNIFPSQHIGDLESKKTADYFKTTIDDFRKMYDLNPSVICCDLHPDYYSTKFAEKLGGKIVRVQHHYAHVLSCMAEHDLEEDVLGISWDGTGYGLDKTVWGGEFFIVNKDSYDHFGHFKKFYLLGGEKAVQEPRRAGLGLLYGVFGDSIFYKESTFLRHFSPKDLELFRVQLQRKINCPLTSSVGRIFDGVSSLLEVCFFNEYEGHAAMNLEFTLDESVNGAYDFVLEESGKLVVDWIPMVKQILESRDAGEDIATISAKFHNTLVNVTLAVAKKSGKKNVVLTGGCFQNKYLLENSIRVLRDNNFNVYWNKEIPINDAGVSVGQIMEAARLSDD